MADATIFETLKRDHDAHRQLIDKLQSTGEPDQRAKLFEQFRVEVTAHAAAEEETLYATMLAQPDLREDAQHSVAEHKRIDDLLEPLQGLDANSAEWEEQFAALSKLYLHHISEEEQEMFPNAAEEFSAAEEGALADKFAERKPAELERAEKI